MFRATNAVCVLLLISVYYCDSSEVSEQSSDLSGEGAISPLKEDETQTGMALIFIK